MPEDNSGHRLERPGLVGGMLSQSRRAAQMENFKRARAETLKFAREANAPLKGNLRSALNSRQKSSVVRSVIC
jgi:hypothetical protein